MAGPPNLGELTAFTKDFGTGIATDNIYNKMFTLMMMRDREQTYPGGEYIREILEYDDDPQDTTGGPVSRTGAFEYIERESHDAAQFRPRYYVQTNVIWDPDVAANGTSETQFYDFMMNRQRTAAKRMRVRFARHIFQAGRGGLQINGFGDIFDNDSVFGRIDRSKESWFNSIIHGSSSVRGFAVQDLANAVSDGSDGDDMPHAGITTPYMWNAMMATADTQQRYTNTKLADLGFENIIFQGIPFIKDKYCDVDASDRHKIYMLNFNHLKLRPHKDWNMIDRPWERLPNQLGQYQVKVWFGNITCNSLRRQILYRDLNPAATIG